MKMTNESAPCQRFVQNAWKKELCSNCFKYREDHRCFKEKSNPHWGLYQVTSFPKQSILKSSATRKQPLKVSFHSGECEIIGFGGDHDSSDEEFGLNINPDDSYSDVDDNEEDLEFEKLTKSNTSFNSVASNLQWRNLTNLKLGEKLVDATGQKRTLQVSIEPFTGRRFVEKSTNKLSNSMDSLVVLYTEKSCAERKISSEVNTPAKDNEEEAVGYIYDRCPDKIEEFTTETADKTKGSHSGETSGDGQMRSDKKATSCAQDSVTKRQRPSNGTKGFESNSNSEEIKQNIRNVRSKLEPLFKTGFFSEQRRLYKNEALYKLDDGIVPDSETRIKPLPELPLIPSKRLQIIELSKPGSRESVGEPDGKADSDDPSDCSGVSGSHSPDRSSSEELSIAPNPQRSFLHRFEREKPKTAPKFPNSTNDSSESEYSATPVHKAISRKASSDSCGGSVRSMKRPAPKPPSPCLSPEFFNSPTVSIVLPARSNNSEYANGQEESSEVQENFTSSKDTPTEPCNVGTTCSYNLVSAQSLKYDVSVPGNRSLSCDSIVGGKYGTAATKVRYTLKKILKFSGSGIGSGKDEKDKVSETGTPMRKRLEIIHPLDINRSGVQVVRCSAFNGTTGMGIDVEGGEESRGGSRRCSSPSVSSVCSYTSGRPSKPPPPPRSQSLEICCSKPVKHPSSSKFLSVGVTVEEHGTETEKDLKPPPVPVKPQRSSSMRDRQRGGGDCHQKRSDLKVEPLGETLVQLTEHMTASDCSDLEHEPNGISFLFDKFENEEDIDLGRRVRNQRGRNVLYTNLEDTYGAVVVTVHETLSQLLEQVNHSLTIPSHLKSIYNSSSELHWTDFVVEENSRICYGDWTFYNAKLNSVSVVISVCSKYRSPIKSLPLWISLTPLMEFADHVPCHYSDSGAADSEMQQAFVTIWNESEVTTLQSYAVNGVNNTNTSVCTIIQLINALKCLQACGIEETSLSDFVICHQQDRTSPPKLYVLPNISEPREEERKMSLCKCASEVLSLLLSTEDVAQGAKQILRDERSSSLSRAKAVLEFWYWGPIDVKFTLIDDKITTLQRWLDLERATLLHSLVCSRSLHQLSSEERCHLIFLVRTNAKTLLESSILLDNKCKS